MPTRFRAYQLGSEGSSFSYCSDSGFTLIEARITKTSAKSLLSEVNASRVVDCLHITSWDLDHCDPAELALILKYFQPKRIEYPGYPPPSDKEQAQAALKLIREYQAQQKIAWSPVAIASLPNASEWGRSDLLCWPETIGANCNDNSTVKLFRSGDFTVLSLGDVESAEIANQLLSTGPIIRNEVDVMILAHHGADNGFTTIELIKAISPRVAICSSNYDNKYEHPRQEIRDILWECEVPLFTTKTGDVVIDSLVDGGFRVTNLIADSTEVSSMRDFRSKRNSLLRLFAVR